MTSGIVFLHSFCGPAGAWRGPVPPNGIRAHHAPRPDTTLDTAGNLPGRLNWVIE
jgi:hypothetical protein